MARESRESSKGLKTVGPGEVSPQDPGARYFVPPTEQTDYERRMSEERIAAGSDEEPHPLSVELGTPRNFQVEGNDTTNFVGVSPEYRNYADVTGQPFRAEGGPVADAEDKILNNDNFPYQGPQARSQGEQIVGTGSTMQTIVPGTSGEGVSGYIVETTKDADTDEGGNSPEVETTRGSENGPADLPTPPPAPGT